MEEHSTNTVFIKCLICAKYCAWCWGYCNKLVPSQGPITPRHYVLSVNETDVNQLIL